jgi:hypothetical protein
VRAVLDRRKLRVPGGREPLDEPVKVAAVGEVARPRLRVTLGHSFSRGVVPESPHGLSSFVGRTVRSSSVIGRVNGHHAFCVIWSHDHPKP